MYAVSCDCVCICMYSVLFEELPIRTNLFGAAMLVGFMFVSSFILFFFYIIFHIPLKSIAVGLGWKKQEALSSGECGSIGTGNNTI